MERFLRKAILTLSVLGSLFMGLSVIQNWNTEPHFFGVPGTLQHPMKPLVEIVPPLGVFHIFGPIFTHDISAPSKVFEDFFRTRSAYAFLRALYSPAHAQVGLVTINLNISTQGCTQLLAGTTTTKIFVYTGLVTVNAQGTGQLLSFVPGLTNGTGTTCGTGSIGNASTSTIGTLFQQATGTSATASTAININQGAPAMIYPTSSAADVTTATASQVGGWITVAQQ